MSDIDKVLEHVAAARAALPEAINRTLTSGRYDEARPLLDIAEALTAVEERLLGLHEARPRAIPVRQVSTEYVDTFMGRFVRRAPVPAEVHPYPIFHVEGQQLIKIGRARHSDSAEYRQAIPREAFEELVSWIISQPLGRGWMSRDMESAMVARHVPSYAVYAALASLRSVGLVTKLARGEYGVSDLGRRVPINEWWAFMAENLERIAREGGGAIDKG